MIIYQHQTELNDSFSALNNRQLIPFATAKVLSVSLEKTRFEPTGTGYTSAKYLAIVITDGHLLNPPSPLYAKSESGAAWAAINGAITAATYLNNNLWRLTIDPAKPLPPIA